MILVLSPEGILTSNENVRDFVSFAYAQIGTDIIECITLAPNMEMWVDEEGALKSNRKTNLYAVLAASMFSGQVLRQRLYGTVILTGPNHSDLPLDDEAVRNIKDILRR